MAGEAAIGQRVGVLETKLAAHESGCAERWNGQRKFNDHVESRLDGHAALVNALDDSTDQRIKALENQSRYREGIWATIGAVVGSGGVVGVIELIRMAH